MDTTYVALDLELQDTADRGREILEIGAVRFRGPTELDSFSRFVQTSVPVSHRTTRLTGLEQADLVDAVRGSDIETLWRSSRDLASDTNEQGRDVPFIEILMSDGCEHFDEHREYIEKILVG